MKLLRDGAHTAQCAAPACALTHLNSRRILGILETSAAWRSRECLKQAKPLLHCGRPAKVSLAPLCMHVSLVVRFNRERLT